MSAPERIYLDGDAEAGDGYFTRCFETAKPCSEPAIEYVRADLCDPTQDERVKRLVELLNEPVVTHTDQWWIDARKAALRDLERWK